MKKFISIMLILSTLLSLTIICNATLIADQLIDIPAEEEIMPMMWDGCGYNYIIYSSLHACPEYNRSFVASGQTFYVPMTNESLYDYLYRQSQGNWKKAYQNGYIDGVKYSLHYFKNTSGNGYANLKICEGWVI